MIRTILLVALLLRIAAALFWQDKVDADLELFRFGDSETYWILAEKIADGRPYEYAGPNSRVFRTPLYPIFLAPATLLEGRVAVLAARIAGCFAGTIMVGLVMLAAYLIVDRRAAICAGILAAVYPGAIGMSVFILSEVIFCPLCLLSLIAWNWAGLMKVEPEPQKTSVNRAFVWTAASGIASGLACLSRPSWFLWPGLLAIGMFLDCWLSRTKKPIDRRRIGSVFVRVGIFGMMMSLTMSPWWIRNYLVTGQFIPTTLQVGPSLYDGLHPGATGSSDEGMAFSLPFEMELHLEDVQAIKDRSRNASRVAAERSPGKSFEWRLNQRMFLAAIRWANENRSDTLRLALVKFGKMWNPWPTAKELGGVWIRIAESVAYCIIVTLAGIALWSVRQHRRSMMLYVSPTFYFAALHVVFVGSVRYRQPAILMLCVVAGIGAAWMLERIKDQIDPRLTRRL